MKTIRQLSEELKISKEAIYKKIKFQLKEELEPHIFKFNNVTHLDDEGERLIMESLTKERRDAIQYVIHTEGERSTDKPNAPHMLEFIGLLQEQIQMKDFQLQNQNTHISQLMQILNSHQFLLQTERTRNIASLKSENARRMPEAAGAEALAAGANASKGFWDRFFRK